MKFYRVVLAVAILLATAVVWLPHATGNRTADLRPLPDRFTDAEFWQLSHELSEPNGSFRSDNLLSNEVWFQHVIPDLTALAHSGGAYIGVGPEQNFTYIAALKPKIAFIVDIRRGNLDLHLMYKALFELSSDRAEFVSRLFSKKRPDGLGPKSTAREIFTALAAVEKSQDLYDQNLKAIKDNLTVAHGFALSADDIEGIEHVLSNFYLHGPAINYGSSNQGGYGGGGMGRVTYSELMAATDADGETRSYLATEDNFAFLKGLQAKNLIVPVVGNFAGPKAIRSVAKYLKDKEATVSAFYLSNVEQYLQQDGIWMSFCGNAAALPLDETSTFIRSARGGSYGQGGGLSQDLGNMLTELKTCSGRRSEEHTS